MGGSLALLPIRYQPGGWFLDPLLTPGGPNPIPLRSQITPSFSTLVQLSYASEAIDTSSRCRITRRDVFEETESKFYRLHEILIRKLLRDKKTARRGQTGRRLQGGDTRDPPGSTPRLVRQLYILERYHPLAGVIEDLANDVYKMGYFWMELSTRAKGEEILLV